MVTIIVARQTDNVDRRCLCNPVLARYIARRLPLEASPTRMNATSKAMTRIDDPNLLPKIAHRDITNYRNSSRNALIYHFRVELLVWRSTSAIAPAMVASALKLTVKMNMKGRS
jgi:hypothetical protein